MIAAAAAFGLAAAAFNVGVSWAVTRSAGGMSSRYWALQAAGFACRAAVLFGAATAWWRRTHDANGVVVLLLTGAIAQLIAQVGLNLRTRK